ncbi:NUDIX hydrolase [Flavobacterium sp.]|uniref:NUDIX hydrolase n=1 Tax=Flavobacterium sp. TaxID=239 RepID=UPI00261B2152|nr:NUDIX hydrolase [Flavobacterium sp.]
MRVPTAFVTVDVLLFKAIESINYLLLIERKNEPFKNCWALPGGFVEQHENLVDAAKRELQEETNITIHDLQQLGAFGKPFRDPRGHVISIAYFGFVSKETEAVAADDAKAVRWFSVNELPEMAFDHLEIINLALTKI